MKRKRRLRVAQRSRDILPLGPSSISALGFVAILLVAGMDVIAPTPECRIESSWSSTTIRLTGNVQLTVDSISEFHIYGAQADLPVLLMMEVQLSARNLESFTVQDMSVKGVSPRGASAELLHVGIDSEGLRVDPGTRVAWSFLVVPHFPKNPPLQVQLSVDCIARGIEFSIRTNAVFRVLGQVTATPITLTHVFSPDHTPWLAENSWSGRTYFYSIEALYAVGEGISLYTADLVLIFTSEHPMVPDSIMVFLAGATNEIVHLDISDAIASGRIPMNGGAYLCPGYLQSFHLGIEFSLQMTEQEIGWTFFAESV